MTATLAPEIVTPEPEITLTVEERRARREEYRRKHNARYVAKHRAGKQERELQLIDAWAANKRRGANGGSVLRRKDLHDGDRHLRMTWWFKPGIRSSTGNATESGGRWVQSVNSPGKGWTEDPTLFMSDPSRLQSPEDPIRMDVVELDRLMNRVTTLEQRLELLRCFPRAGRYQAPNVGTLPQGAWFVGLIRILGKNLTRLNAKPSQDLWGIDAGAKKRRKPAGARVLHDFDVRQEKVAEAA